MIKNKSWVKFRIVLILLCLVALGLSQTGDVGIPDIQYFNQYQCDSIDATTIIPFNRVICLYWHRGVQKSATKDWDRNFMGTYTVQGTVITCPTEALGDVDTLYTPWLLESNGAWLLENGTDYWSKEQTN